MVGEDEEVAEELEALPDGFARNEHGREFLLTFGMSISEAFPSRLSSPWLKGYCAKSHVECAWKWILEISKRCIWPRHTLYSCSRFACNCAICGEAKLEVNRLSVCRTELTEKAQNVGFHLGRIYKQPRRRCICNASLKNMDMSSFVPSVASNYCFKLGIYTHSA